MPALLGILPAPILLGILSALLVALLVAVLCSYLATIGKTLGNIADNLEDCNGSAKMIFGHAKLIVPGVTRINNTGGQIAGALPLLVGLAETIRDAASPHTQAAPPALPEREVDEDESSPSRYHRVNPLQADERVNPPQADDNGSPPSRYHRVNPLQADTPVNPPQADDNETSPSRYHRVNPLTGR